MDKKKHGILFQRENDSASVRNVLAHEETSESAQDVSDWPNASVNCCSHTHCSVAIDWKVMNLWTDESKYVKCLSEAKEPNETVTNEEEASSFCEMFQDLGCFKVKDILSYLSMMHTRTIFFKKRFGAGWMDR